MRRKLLERAKALLEEVLNDDTASPNSKREAADMLSKVNERLDPGFELAALERRFQLHW
jgi:hypothetical protein